MTCSRFERMIFAVRNYFWDKKKIRAVVYIEDKKKHLHLSNATMQKTIYACANDTSKMCIRVEGVERTVSIPPNSHSFVSLVKRLMKTTWRPELSEKRCRKWMLMAKDALIGMFAVNYTCDSYAYDIRKGENQYAIRVLFPEGMSMPHETSVKCVHMKYLPAQHAISVLKETERMVMGAVKEEKEEEIFDGYTSSKDLLEYVMDF